MIIQGISQKLLKKRVVGNTTSESSIRGAIHIHGYKKQDMVFGVHDVSQIADCSLFEGYGEEYINQLIKIKTNEMNESNTDQKAFDLLKRSHIIYVYGMSWGDTDLLWWQRICEMMKENKYIRLVLHCHDVPADETVAITYQMYASIKKNEFLRHCQYDESIKRELSKRIYICRKNVFEPIKNMTEKSN